MDNTTYYALYLCIVELQAKCEASLVRIKHNDDCAALSELSCFRVAVLLSPLEDAVWTHLSRTHDASN